MFKIYLLFLVELCFSAPLLGQLSYLSSEDNGVIRGYVAERTTGQSLEGAYVELLNYHPTISTTTDDEGYFELKRIPVGHQRVRVVRDQYYEVLHAQLVVAGKESTVNIFLEERFVPVNVAVEGKASGERVAVRTTKQAVIDPMNAISARPLNLEESDKYVGGYNDPARELTNFAGLYNNIDVRNSIVSRGVSPYDFQVLVEGVPVESMNHFGNLGSTGGLINLVNFNLLDNSDFSNGVLSAQYGNAYAGILDANLRRGNNQRREHLLQVGLFGIEGSAEGPFKQGKGSYAVAARVGLFGVMQSLGVDFGTSTRTQYADLNVKLVFPTERMGQFSLFGIGGYNTGDRPGLLDSIYYNGHVVLSGLSHRIFLNSRSSISTVVSHYRQHYTRGVDSLYQTGLATAQALDQRYDRFGVQTTFNTKINKRLLLRVGAHGFLHRYDLLERQHRLRVDYMRHDAYQLQLHAFAQVQYHFSKRWSTTLGVQAMYWNINPQTWTVEPRVSVNWQVATRHRLSLGYGRHSRIQPPFLQYAITRTNDGREHTPNRALGLIQGDQGNLSYNCTLSKQWSLSTNLYFQYQTGLAVEQTPSSFSVANYDSDDLFYAGADLVDDGQAYNYGVETTLERFFFKGYYGLLTASYQRAFYRGSDAVWRNSSFDVQYIGSLLAGKEIKIGPQKLNALYGDFRFNMRGGQPYVPVDAAASEQAGYTVYQTESAYEERLPNYYRLDVRVGMRFNNDEARISYNFYLEVINVTNAQNYRFTVYDPVAADIARTRQVGFFPNFLYQVRF